MKKPFKGRLKSLPPEENIKELMDKYKLNKEAILEIFDEKREVRYVESQYYKAIEYKIKLNIFAFGKMKLSLPFTVIAMPISVDEIGYQGSLTHLISDYKNRKGNTLILNLRENKIGKTSDNQNLEFAQGKTLPSLYLENKFTSFEDYMNKLRTGYRRRINIALKKGQNLKIQKIKAKDFDNELHKLYLQVLNKSEFPLETLSLEFFRNTNWEYDVFYLDNKPLAFISYYITEQKTSDKIKKTLHFLFGGMDYKHRNQYDLYYNMLIHMIKQGIKNPVDIINLGQTAEGVKQRLGATPKDRTMIAFSNNKLLNKILIKFAPLLANNKNLEKIRALKIDQQNRRL